MLLDVPRRHHSKVVFALEHHDEAAAVDGLAPCKAILCSRRMAVVLDDTQQAEVHVTVEGDAMVVEDAVECPQQREIRPVECAAVVLAYC